MKASVFLTRIVRPTLITIGQSSTVAEMLLMGTAAQESHLIYTRQIGGPALGYFQMEPATHDDCWTNFLDFHPDLAAKVLLVRKAPGIPAADELASDPAYATAMARVRYLRVSEPLPTNGLALAAYWKEHYNTRAGAGTVDAFLTSWHQYLTPSPYPAPLLA